MENADGNCGWSTLKPLDAGIKCSIILSCACNYLSSGGTSSIFHPHAAKKCCAAHGYKMLNVVHQLNTATNSIFAAKNAAKTLQQNHISLILLQSFCSIFLLFDHKIHFWNMISSWPTCASNICRKFYIYYKQHVFARRTQQVNWRRKTLIDWILQRKQRIMGDTGDNKKPKSTEKKRN